MLISGLRTTRISKQTILQPKSWGDQYIVGPPNLKVGAPVSPVPTVVALMAEG